MVEATYLTVAVPNCVADDFGGEIVALNLDTGFYFSLRDLAAAVWRDLAAGHSVESVLGPLGAQAPHLAEDATRLIDRIQSEGLMQPAVAVVLAEGDPSVATFIAGGMTSLVIDSYDDLRDLVMTDPIHEVVEEVGWPVRREDA
ncbi:PqqD family protein [Kaistia defluvii]|uniref:PqqD family protein n=1 Tax=Kaistia defluvii TaxID=410841 RepID=UPI0022586BAE|nr:PqqD family protein [Kaistia defluvii]MCX5518798.1 PqqD family protein [Kaistia defluvii]